MNENEQSQSFVDDNNSAIGPSEAETIAFDSAVQGDSLRGIHIISKEAERLTERTLVLSDGMLCEKM